MNNELTQAEQAVEKLTPVALSLVKDANARALDLKFPNKEAFAEGDRLYNEVHRAWKTADDDRKSFTAPLNTVIDNINARYKPLLEPLATAKKNLKLRMDAFATDELIWRRKEDARIVAEKRKADEEALAAATKLADEGKEKEADAVVAQAVAEKPVFSVGATDTAKSFTKTMWRADIVDVRKFLHWLADSDLAETDLFVTIETAALNRYAQATKGSKPIPGIEIKEVAAVGAHR